MNIEQVQRFYDTLAMLIGQREGVDITVTNIAYAMVEYGGTMHKAKILTRERLKDGRVALSISITPEASGTTTITKIQLYDTASKLWAEKSEAIKLKGTQQGVLYRFSFNFKEE